jgi:anti-anti-sigma regulatory factor
VRPPDSARKYVAQDTAIVPQVRHFAHRDAWRIYNAVLRNYAAKKVVLDLSRAVDATTSAFARLVLLRRELRRRGGDLILTGLRDRTAKLYQLSRLDGVLPCY